MDVDKMAKELETFIQTVKIYIWYRKMYHANNVKRQMTEGVEQLNVDKNQNARRKGKL